MPLPGSSSMSDRLARRFGASFAPLLCASSSSSFSSNVYDNQHCLPSAAQLSEATRGGQF